MRVSKQKKIYKSRNYKKYPSDNEKHQPFNQASDPDQQIRQQVILEKLSQDQQIQLKPLKFMEVPLNQVPYLQPEERIKLREEFPNLADYIFMSQREKTKYFHQKNLCFRKLIETPGNLPARKIQFKRKFEVKVFNSQEPCSEIKTAKCQKCKYDPKVHHS